MSKRNKRRFWQSQSSHIKAMLDMDCTPGIDLFDYHMDVYRKQKFLGKILSREERRQIWMREVHP